MSPPEQDNSPSDRGGSLPERIKRNPVVKWTGSWAVIAATLFQLLDIAVNRYSWDPRVASIGGVLLAISILLVAIGSWYHAQRNATRASVPEMAIIMLLVGIGGLLSWMIIDRRRVAAPVEPEVVSVLVVTSGAPPYERAIVEAFHSKLQKGLEARNHKLDWKIRPYETGYTVPPPGGDGARPPKTGESAEADNPWVTLADNIVDRYEKKSIDYVVTVGTYASVAFNQMQVASRIRATRGQVFLGVTDPRGAGLVQNLRNRDVAAEKRISGVRYGSGGDKFLTCVAKLFPAGQRLVFVREGNSPQDKYIADQFPALKASLGVEFVDHVYTGVLVPDKLSDPDAIYFAWYGFDNILEDVGSKDLEQFFKKKVVPSTFSNENLESAGLVVSVNDAAVGEAGAQLLLDALSSGAELGQTPVADVPFYYWVDKSVAIFKELHVPARLLDQAGGARECTNLD